MDSCTFLYTPFRRVACFSLAASVAHPPLESVKLGTRVNRLLLLWFAPLALPPRVVAPPVACHRGVFGTVGAITRALPHRRCCDGARCQCRRTRSYCTAQASSSHPYWSPRSMRVRRKTHAGAGTWLRERSRPPPIGRLTFSACPPRQEVLSLKLAQANTLVHGIPTLGQVLPAQVTSHAETKQHSRSSVCHRSCVASVTKHIRVPGAYPCTFTTGSVAQQYW